MTDQPGSAPSPDVVSALAMAAGVPPLEWPVVLQLDVAEGGQTAVATVATTSQAVIVPDVRLRRPAPTGAVLFIGASRNEKPLGQRPFFELPRIVLVWVYQAWFSVPGAGQVKATWRTGQAGPDVVTESTTEDRHLVAALRDARRWLTRLDDKGSQPIARERLVKELAEAMIAASKQQHDLPFEEITYAQMAEASFTTVADIYYRRKLAKAARPEITRAEIIRAAMYFRDEGSHDP